ncbi:protein GDAP2 homolog [Daphnia magna]|uniref:Uncharacterized protein n=2 Tax=Daphnia magna TaxID=35525 RepID=A0ABQ9YXK6_9CRUS|nr:protein GDAP2 homolog [Daphnia magna]KAK4005387.1 hypothetical protein OUZ56_007101 [Daphnia magna]KZS03003.1 Ganglioside-induced differentiation-associated protein 2 [Daphnia magna]
MEVESLARWSETNATNSSFLRILGLESYHESAPFKYRPDLNKKIILWEGDITALSVNALVHPTNESFTESSQLSQKVIECAGSKLKEELTTKIKYCRTGEAKITQGFDLPARYIIHTVGPKYNARYKTAAETALYFCYRNVMELVHEYHLSSVAIPIIYTVKRGYPPDEGAHLALRTIRRFLEQYGDSIESVILVLDANNYGIYQVLSPLYFPRSVQEAEFSRYQLPFEIGDPVNGEPIISDRRIRIIDNPQHAFQDSWEEPQDLSAKFGCSVSVGEHSFAQMEDDVDRQKLLGQPSHQRVGQPVTDIDHLTLQVQHHERYERLLRRAKTEDLSEVSGIGCLYQSGTDKFGRPVVVFIGKWFNFNEINLDKALLYLISLLDPLVKGDYIILYFHTLTEGHNHPSMTWMREVYNVLEYRHKKNLKGFYIIHPTFWTKVMTWWFLTFMAPAIKHKVHSVPGVEYLYNIINMDQLEIPAFITEYDMTVNGVRYVEQPSSDE